MNLQSIFEILSSVLKKTLKQRSHLQKKSENIKSIDPWFYDHYIWAADIVKGVLVKYVKLEQAKILDIGCGDGIMALGVSNSSARQISGVDLTDAFSLLPDRAKDLLGLKKLPNNLQFIQIEENMPLLFHDENFDAIYSWSVFEHVQDIPVLLKEAYRVLKTGGIFFLQIEPLYFSPHGSHLQRLIDKPWGHLLIEEELYIRMAEDATDNVTEKDKDLLYRKNEFEDVKNFLIAEYHMLNKITVDRLLSYIEDAGFTVAQKHTAQVSDIIPEQLKKKYAEIDLRTNEIRLELLKEQS